MADFCDKSDIGDGQGDSMSVAAWRQMQRLGGGNKTKQGDYGYVGRLFYILISSIDRSLWQSVDRRFNHTLHLSRSHLTYLSIFSVRIYRPSLEPSLIDAIRLDASIVGVSTSCARAYAVSKSVCNDKPQPLSFDYLICSKLHFSVT
jgi:hypothetical protein